MENNPVVVDVNDVTIRFNRASEKIDNLKEYFVKLVKKELMFQEFLAVKNASFQIRKGEAWALIGTNGSGKSTLLKAISGILKPYKGSIIVKGTIAPLIELGAGFDPNLTARENIFLNGCVLGHSEKFMREHFDEIVEFANLNQKAGVSKMAAISEASVQRLRPILMTSASTVLGLLPLMFATGEGCNGRIAMGTAVVGGMIISTLLTMYIVPAIYSFVSTDISKKVED